ncbi:MAG: DMT family transporter [Clostridia bacterium]|nr:DMT family transporter [Clostridia bacterium]
MKKNSIVSILVLFVTAIVWGFAFPFQDIAADYISTFWFNGIRFIIGAISLIPVVLIFEREKLTKTQWKKLIISSSACGILLFAASALQQVGISISGSSAKAAFITGLYMVFVPFCGIFMGKKIRTEAWIGAAAAVVGLYFVCFANGFENASVGDMVTLLGAFVWTAHIVCIDKFASDCPSLKFSLFQFIACGIFNLAVAPFAEGALVLDGEAVKNLIIPVLYCGIGSVGVAYTCQVIGQRGTEPALASIILCTESIFAAIGEMPVYYLMAALGFGGGITKPSPLPLSGYFGCALIFVGILLSQAKIFKKKA